MLRAYLNLHLKYITSIYACQRFFQRLCRVAQEREEDLENLRAVRHFFDLFRQVSDYSHKLVKNETNIAHLDIFT